VCGRHSELHALWRYVNHLEMTSCGEQPQTDEPLAPVLRNGNYRICQEPMGSRDVKESCVCCHVTVHQVCVTGQLVNADWSAVRDRSDVELFCCGCVVERFMDGCLLARFASPRNGSGVCNFRAGSSDAFVSEKGEGVWTWCARNAVNEGLGLHTRERQEANVAVGEGAETRFGGTIGGRTACASGG
jgi:hypothetical protein